MKIIITILASLLMLTACGKPGGSSGTDNDTGQNPVSPVDPVPETPGESEEEPSDDTNKGLWSFSTPVDH